MGVWGFVVASMTAQCPNWVKRGASSFKGQYVVNIPLDLSSSQTIDVVKDVLTEVADIFPDPWLHIGFDELPADCYRESLGGDYHRHVRSFLIDIHSFATKLNRTLVIWDDGIPDMPNNDYVAEVWHGDSRITNKLEMTGTRFISTGKSWYFDVGCTNAYSCHQAEAPLPAHFKQYIGAEACAWELSENPECRSEEQKGEFWDRNFDIRVWDRLIGFAEAAWSPRAIKFSHSRYRAVVEWLCSLHPEGFPFCPDILQSKDI